MDTKRLRRKLKTDPSQCKYGGCGRGNMHALNIYISYFIV